MPWTLAATLAATTLTGMSSGSRAGVAPGSAAKWRPHAAVAEPSVPGHKTPGSPAAQPKKPAVTPAVPPAWPAAASADVILPAPDTPAAVHPSGLPVSLSLGPVANAASRTPTQVSVHVAVADHAAAERAGVAGVILSAGRTDSATGAAPVALAVDYSGFGTAFGGSFADRLRLVALPACALTTPSQAACRTQTPIAFTNSRAAKTLNTTIALRSAAAAHALVLAATSAPSSGNGDYTATPLKASDTWTVTNAGSFSYSYPMTAPPSLGGAAPQLGMNYSSSTLDGQTANANSQGSQIGDGWDAGAGYIERSFTSCAKVPGAPASWKEVGDVCMGIPNATVSLAGHSGELVHDDATGTWRLSGDDGSRVEELTGAANGDPADNNAYWRLTTTDGTQYYFGANRLPAAAGGTGTDAPTYSAWGEPVFGTGAGTTCNDPTAPGVDPNACRAGWRWNLDFVVDPHGNIIRYDYLREYNFYTHAATGNLVQYTSAGYLSQIEYGFRTPDVAAGLPPAERVDFALVPRCIFDDGPITCPSALTTPGPGLVSAGITDANDAAFRDVPADQMCAATGPCGNVAPTFFQTARLASVTTRVRVNGTFTPVDAWETEQHWEIPDSGDVALEMDAVTHTGLSGGQHTQLPDVTFSYQFFDSRAKISPVYTSQGPSSSARLTQVDDELGGDIRATYDTAAYPCTGAAPPVDANHTLCFPEYWVKPGDTTPSLDWFNKWVVTRVQTDDDTKLSGAAGLGSASSVVSDYSYPSAPAWHSDGSEQTQKEYRTFDQFRGFGTVVAVTGGQIDPNAPSKGVFNTLNTKTVTTYLRGMDQDPNLAGVAAPATVTDSRGQFPNTVDDNALAGVVLETQTFESADADAPVLSDVISHPVLSAPTAVHKRIDTLPTQRARFQHTGTTLSYAQVTTGTRRTETNFTFDDSLPTFTGSIASGGNGRQIAAFDQGDGTVPRLCTRTWYANSGAVASAEVAQRSGLADLVTTDVIPAGGSCTWTPTPPQAGTATAQITGTRTYFDGNPLGDGSGPGNATKTEVESANDGGGNATWITKASMPAAAFDVYGRPLQAIDADGNITATAYTPADHALPTSVAVTAPDPATGAVGSWAPTLTTLDPGRAQPLTVTDTNGHKTTIGHDGLGRTTAVWRPDRATSASPDIAYSYFLAGPGGTDPSFVDTDTLTDAAGDTSTSYTIVDGLGRTQQTQTTPTDGSSGQVVTQTSYDALGRAHLADAPFYDAANTPSGSFVQYSDPTQIPSATRTDYNLPAHTVTSTLLGHNQPLWSSLTHTWGADRTDVIPPSGGTATSTMTDARGRTTALWQYHANPPTVNGTATDAMGADVTGYAYGFNGDDTATVTVTDPTGKNTWTTTTDLLGRTIRNDDPDSGVTKSTYDNAGLQLSSTDGRGISLYFTWDHQGRKIGEYSAPVTGTTADQGNQILGWTYDTVLKGQPSVSTRYVGGSGPGGLAYTSAITGYDVANRPTGSQVSIPTSGPDAAFGGVYQSTTAYTVTGQVDHYTVPAVPAAGLAADTITDKYTPTGVLNSARGSGGDYQDLLDDSEVSPFGEVTSQTLGEAPYQVVTQNVYDQATRRLVQSFTDASAGTDAGGTVVGDGVDHRTYTYDPAGKLTSANNDQSPGGGSGVNASTTDLQCYSYDPLGRLLHAWTDNAGTTPAPSPTPGSGTAAGGLGACTSVAPTTATTTGSGPAPYWQDFTGSTPGMATDSMGNRVTVTDHGIGSGSSTIQTYGGYAEPGTRNTLTSGSSVAGSGPGPHLLGTVTTNGGAAGTDVYAYDAEGNTTTRQVAAAPGTNAANQTLTWDTEGHLTQVVDTASHDTATYLYDAGGTQLIRRDTDTTTGQTSSTLYLGATEIHVTDGKTTAQRYYAFSGSPTTIVNSDGTVAIEAADGLGTGDTTIDDSPGHQTRGHISARRYTEPYGEARGTAPATFGAFPDDHTFLGKTSDADTGLVDVGARKYAPSTGRFISIDPVFSSSSPQALGGYAYASNDPINGSDPSGLVAQMGGNGDVPMLVDSSDQAYAVVASVGVGDWKKGDIHPWIVAPADASWTNAFIENYYNELGQWVPGWTKADTSNVPFLADAGTFGAVAQQACGQIPECKSSGWYSLYEQQRWTASIAGAEAASAGQAGRVEGDAEVGISSEEAAMIAAQDSVLGQASGPLRKLMSKLTKGPLRSLGSDDESIGASCVTHSFAGGTKVLLSDGVSEPIQDVKVGDEVENAQPGGGIEHHRVDEIHKTLTDKDFTDLTVTTPTGTTTITGTQNHPYYDLTAGRFVDAADLLPGDRLQTTGGDVVVSVLAVRNYTASMVTYDLTIDSLHTYYVVAGDTPVLVHNAGGKGWCGGPIPNTGLPINGEYPSGGQTSFYVIHDPATGEILKWGITDNVFTRYNATDFANWTNEYGGDYQMTILKNFDSEADAAAVEYYMTSRHPGPANKEPNAGWISSRSTTGEDLQTALNLFPSGG
ncbi:RHS repeat-associated protein [Catenulispora sp. GP43]|uniref:RHS repeat-associated core domain-containing protein n=1 Tax=Catenulispora sp. GP43 TaxID=3156263 RepID=UPI003517D28B